MTERELLVMWFGLGVALQVLFLIRGDWRWGRLGACLGLSLFALFPGKHEHIYEPLFHVFTVIVVFAALFAVAFKEDLLPAVNEKILLSDSMTLWFALISYLQWGSALQIQLMLVAAPLTVATAYIAFRQTTLKVAWKVVFYTWFLAIVVSLGLMQFSYRQLGLFFAKYQMPWVTPLECVTGGMTFLFLAVYATYIFYLIPMKGKHQTWEERMKTWHAFTNLMTQRFDETPPRHVQVLGLIALQGGVFALLALNHRAPTGLVINLAVLAPAWIPFFRSRPGPAAVAANVVPPAVGDPQHRVKNRARRDALRW